jgi:hypothetical protein
MMVIKDRVAESGRPAKVTTAKVKDVNEQTGGED